MYKKREHLHFMGIGGIGMSGIARILRLMGYPVSGCDSNTSNTTIKELQEIGCSINTGHCTSHMKQADVLVLSSAIKQDNPEVVAALSKGIPVIPRAIMLAELMRTKYSVAVSGSHGKTTTTSLISHILLEARLSPTVVIGGVLKNISRQAELGNSDILIAEADESDRSLLYLNPTLAVVTNIDAEHLDTYKDLDDVQATFKNFLARLPFYGKAFVCSDDKNIQAILPMPHVNITKYGFNEQADIIGEIISLEKDHSIFKVYSNELISGTPNKEKKLLGTIKLSVPGSYNVSNALAALCVCREFDVPFDVIAQALANFKGVERRFEFKGTFNGAEIFDDYAHHPTEIKHALAVASKRKQKNLLVIFQPHRYTRTQGLWNEFVETFEQAENVHQVYITDIYPASEEPIDGVSSQKLVETIQAKNPGMHVTYLKTYDEIFSTVSNELSIGDLLLTVGAGKANLIGEKLIQAEHEKN